jgi:hypothetical protein
LVSRIGRRSDSMVYLARAGGPGHAFGRFRDNASSTAMRTATPISTCSRINDKASATLDRSRRRVHRPRCITSASAWRRASSHRGRNRRNIPASRARTSRSCACSRSIITMSALRRPSRMSRQTSTPKFSMPGGNRVEARRRTRAPSVLSRMMLSAPPANA